MADEFAGSPDAHAEGGDGLLQADPEIAVGDGFEAFVRAQQPSLAAYLARRMPEADVPDVMQDAMIRLLRYRGLPEMQLRPLLYRIAQNVMHDRGRRDLSHRRQDHVALDEYGTGLASPDRRRRSCSRTGSSWIGSGRPSAPCRHVVARSICSTARPA
jgi:hypothetical protein